MQTRAWMLVVVITLAMGCQKKESGGAPVEQQPTEQKPPPTEEKTKDPGPGPVSSAHETAHQNGVPHADRIVFFLGDGMGIPVVTAARIFAKGEEGSLTMDTLPESAFIRTYSRNSRVTDSAPSMSAYMTGEKMDNDVISMKPEVAYKGKGEAVPTLLEWAKAAGWGTGVVTTTRVTHATPAATYAHISDRDLEAEIARQLVPGGEGYNSTLLSGVDVILGGGRAQFLPKGVDSGVRADGRNLIEELKAKGYSEVSQRAQLLDVPVSGTPPKLIGLFHASHMSYELQRPAIEPSLSDMAVKAVQLLNQNPKGFFLMVEGGRIDHALHDSTAKKALRDTVAFDDAIAAVLAELRKTDPELKNTLVVVTADHDHTLLHQGYARRTGPTTPTNPGVLGLVRAYNTPEGAPVLDADGRPYSILSFGNGERRVAGARSSVAALAEESTSSDEYRQEAAIRMPVASETHGGTDVSLKAIGFGSESFHGFLTNTEVFPLLRKATQL